MQEFFFWNWTSINTLFFSGFWLRQCFAGALRSRPRGAEGSSQATPRSTARTKVYMPITWHTVGKTLLRSLNTWCWIPQLPKMHFCLWMDAKLSLLRANKRFFHHEADVTFNMHFFEIVHFFFLIYFFFWNYLTMFFVLFSLEVIAFFPFKILHVLRVSTVYNKYGKYCSQLLLFDLV